MAEYIERTEELMLAMNAGARAIENTRRYHGAIYTKDVFLESPQEIPYLQAAKVLREVSDAPTVDAVPVIRCKDCTFGHYIDYGHMHCIHPCGLTTNMTDDFCSYAERKEKKNERMD